MTLQAGSNVAPTYLDPTKVSFGSKSEKYCITCGKSKKVTRCARCKGAWYCDSDCQQADWPCHKLLCAKYAKLNESEPIKNGYRAFLFRADSLEPEMLLLPVTWRGERDFQPVIELLRHEGSTFGNLELAGFGFNMRLNKSPIYAKKKYLGLQVACRSTHAFDGSPPNKSVLASVKAIGKTPPHLWAGNIVVRRQHDSGSGLRAGSVTMADFRHIVDWSAFYPKMPDLDPWDQNPLEPSPWFSAASTRIQDIQGVQINVDPKVKDKSDRYMTVDVPANHLIRGIIFKPRGSISPISKLVGRPLRLVMRAHRAHDDDTNSTPPTCGPAKDLMRRIENDTSIALPEIEYCDPLVGLPHIGHVLVVRTDDKDLSVDEVKAMAYFSKSMCREVLQSVALASREDNPDMEVSLQRALGFMTWDNYLLAFDKLGLPRPQQPAGEAFTDLRGPDTPDEVDDSIEEDEEDEDDPWDDGWSEDEFESDY